MEDLNALWNQAKSANPIEYAIANENVSPQVADIARSIYQQESGSGKNTTTSNAGARGGMQIIPATFNRVADKGWDINNPEQNARAGLRYVAMLNDKAGGDPALTAAGYYGGEGAIKKAQQGIAVSDPRNPNAPNTLQYAKQVTDRLPQAPAEDLNKLWESASQNVVAKPKYSPAQLAAAKNPNTFTQDLQQELKDNPISAKLAAAGTALSDLYQGAKQTIGLGDKEAIKNNATIAAESPISAILGNVALYGALGGASPALSTVKGASVAGAALGAVAPTQDDNVISSKVKAALAGAALGGATAKVGQAAGTYFNNKQAAANVIQSQNATRDATLKDAVSVGYKVPPDYAGAGTTARVLGGVSGKLKTAELATIKNQSVTNNLAREGLGLSKMTSLSESVIDDLKSPFNAVYKEASSLSSGVVGQTTSKSMGTGNQVTKDITKSGEQLVNDIKNARDDARSAWKSFNTGMASNPNNLRNQAVASGKLADSLENQLEILAKNNGSDTLVSRLKDARQNLAKINLYDDALNYETGNIKASVIGKALTKGKPLDSSAMKIAKFNNAFGDLARVSKTMDAAPITPLDVVGGALTGGIAPIARLGSRSIVLSNTMQKAMANKNYDLSNVQKSLKGILSSRYTPMAVTGGTVPALTK